MIKAKVYFNRVSSPQQPPKQQPHMQQHHPTLPPHLPPHLWTTQLNVPVGVEWYEMRETNLANPTVYGVNWLELLVQSVSGKTQPQ